MLFLILTATSQALQNMIQKQSTKKQANPSIGNPVQADVWLLGRPFSHRKLELFSRDTA